MLGTGVILVGHGSRMPEAEHVLPNLAGMLAKASGHMVDYGYMQFAAPTISETIERVAERSPENIILLPVFITNGQHVATDIPAALKPLCAKHKHISFLLGEALGADYRLVEILNERLMALQGRVRGSADISASSFRLIEAAADLPDDPGQREIARRVVHATGDATLSQALLFSPNAVKAGVEAFQKCAVVVTDVQMVKAGISPSLLPLGNKVISGIETVETGYPALSLTRCAQGIVDVLKNYPQALIVVGNAPTALREVCRLIDEGAAKPPLVIGTPVGFVGAAEAKAALTERPVDYITLPGTRGGSPVAAAIINALAKLAGQQNGS